MAKHRKKKKHFSLLDALLTAVDALCEGVARLCVGALRGLGRLLALLARGAWALLRCNDHEDDFAPGEGPRAFQPSDR